MNNICPQSNTETVEENDICTTGEIDPGTETVEAITGTEPMFIQEDTVTLKPHPVQSQSGPKEIRTLAEKSATASLSLSIVGVILFFALPIQILALILGIQGAKSSLRIRACIGIGLAVFGIIGFIATLLFIIMNYTVIVNSEIFSYIYFTLFGY